MASHPIPFSRSAALVLVRHVWFYSNTYMLSSRDGQLWNVSNGAVLLAWQAAEAAVVAAGFLSPGRIAVLSSDAIVR